MSSPRPLDQRHLSICSFTPLSFPQLLDTIELRKWILREGLPRGGSEQEVNSLRAQVWKVLLDVPCLFDAELYKQHLQVSQTYLH